MHSLCEIPHSLLCGKEYLTVGGLLVCNWKDVMVLYYEEAQK
jgi:hypothetical protein